MVLIVFFFFNIYSTPECGLWIGETGTPSSSACMENVPHFWMHLAGFCFNVSRCGPSMLIFFQFLQDVRVVKCEFIKCIYYYYIYILTLAVLRMPNNIFSWTSVVYRYNSKSAKWITSFCAVVSIKSLKLMPSFKRERLLICTPILTFSRQYLVND